MDDFWPYRGAVMMVLSCYLIFLVFWLLGVLWNWFVPKRRCNPWLAPAILASMSILGGLDYYVRKGGDMTVNLATLPVLVTCATRAWIWRHRTSSGAEHGITR